MRYVAPSKDEMDAMPPEQAEFHNVSTPWWSQGGTSQGIADCGQCGRAFAIWPKDDRQSVGCGARVRRR